MEKDFYKGATRYSFQFERDASDPNPASEGTFTDEEQVRVKYYYPYIQKGSVVFDVGASFGSYTLPALALGATVFAFSPEHEFPLVRRNIELNGFKDYELFNYGLYSQQGLFKTDTTEFLAKATTPAEGREYSAKSKENESNWTGWWILVYPLDMVAEEYARRIDFLKIDTEGAELEVLKGGIETIKKYKPKLLLELHLFKDRNMHLKLQEFLFPLGYKWQVKAYTPHVSHMFAWI